MHWLVSKGWAAPINGDTFDNDKCYRLRQMITVNRKKAGRTSIIQISHKHCFLLGKSGIHFLSRWFDMSISNRADAPAPLMLHFAITIHYTQLL